MLFPNAGVEVHPALLLLLGLMVGNLSGFFGVGGGFLITGGLLVFGVPPLFAVGTGLSLIMGSSLINTLKHRRVGNVDFKLGALMVIGTIPALFFAERLNSRLEDMGIAGPVIRYVYVGFLTTLGSFLIYDYLRTRNSASRGDQVSTASLAERVRTVRIPPHSIGIPGLFSLSTYVALPISGIPRISIWIPIVVGFGVGFLAGLLGAGGGFILMPILIYVLGVPTTVAIGTDLFQIILTGSVGTLLYSLSRHVDLLMAVMMLATASLGSQFGVAATRFVEASRIRVLYGMTVLSGAVAVALRQASEAGPDYLADVGSILLLSFAGVISLVIVSLLAMAPSKRIIPIAPSTGAKVSRGKQRGGS